MSTITRQALRFGTVGLLNTGLGLCSIWLFMWLGASPFLSNAIGYGVGFISSFVLNRNWSFDREESVGSAGKSRSDMPKFLVAFFISWLLNITVISFGMQSTTVSPYFLQIFGMAAYTISFFVICRLWVFAR